MATEEWELCPECTEANIDEWARMDKCMRREER